MDVLSEVLRAVKLRGALFFNGEFSAPWCFESARSSLAAPLLCPLLGDPAGSPSGSGRLIIFHFLTEGHAYARLAAGPRQELSAGDIVILPHGDAHFVGNGPPVKPVDSFQVFAKNLTQGLKVAHFGGGGEITRFVCGFMACDRRLSEVFLAGLSPLLKVHVADEPSGRWLAHSIRFAVDQAGGASAGSSMLISRLSEALFVEALRRYINAMPANRAGWLAGARDPITGRALALLHKDPSHPWTISDLAKHSGTSRTPLVERFRHFLGQSPMGYLTQWRLELGAEMLESTDNSVLEVAAAVGYGSEATFIRAFKREFGSPPAQFRRNRSAGSSRGSVAPGSRPSAVAARH